MPTLRVAIVAPSLRLLGGQAVHSQRLIGDWSRDGEVCAWLVPIDPELPRPLAVTHKIKYVRTAATQLRDWPQLAIGLRQARALANTAFTRAQSQQWDDVRSAWLSQYYELAHAYSLGQAGLRVGLESK